ncbi:MAG TPA: WG repeat-containing protein, partial [Candidatus Obscuribacter sp.]|nr:WG repeat-containing protein [Candidatus Obscuribacter sp.]
MSQKLKRMSSVPGLSGFLKPSVFKPLLAVLLVSVLTGCGPKKEESSVQAVPELGPKWGFIDHSGKFVIKPQFRRVFSYSEGLAAADLSARWGFIDPTGKFVIERAYEDVHSFSKGYAAVKVFNGKWGLIDKTGNMVVPAKFEQLGDCGEASTPLEPVDIIYCPYREGGKWGYIDLTGEPKIEAKYENVEPYSEGFAAVSQLGKWGFIDKDGKQITELKFDQVRPFRDRVAEGYFGADFVIIGDIGTISMSDPLNSRSFFHDGLGLSLKKGKYGFMNKAGKTVIKRRFTYAEDFSEGLAVVGVANARRGFIDVEGQLVIPPVFDEAQSFSNKLAAVKIDSRLVADDGSISASAIEEAKKNDPHASMTKTGT